MATEYEEPEAPPSEAVMAQAGSTVVVASTKGGVGRTTVAVNLAGALHAAGQRVCVVDLDLEFGDIALSLGVTPARTLVDAIEAAIPEDIDDPLELLKTEFRPGFDCILAPVDPAAARALPATLVADLLPALAETYHYVIVDTSAHQSVHVAAAMRAADRILIVAVPDLLSVKALHLQADLLDMIGAKAGRDLVINRTPVNESSSWGVSASDLASAAGLTPTMSLPNSDDVPRSLIKAAPLVLDDPAHPVSVQFRSLVAGWVGKHGQVVEADGRRRRFGIRKGKTS